MRNLELHPSDYELRLSVSEFPDDGIAEVYVKLGDNSLSHCFNAGEAEKVGRWFVALSKELSKKPKKKPAKTAEEKE